ncbi:MAG: 16S rRNA processing protein RimM, partial [Clostridiales bacterium]|nr:16S rRNA processing protein RimM [Clostridiales bacterium]
MVKQYLEVGKIVGTHGIKGEVRVQPWCDSPEFIRQFKTLYYSPDGASPVKVLSCRPHGNVAIILLDGVGTVEEAAALRSKLLYMNRDDAKLEKGDYFISDLISCRVYDADTGRFYGTLTDVSETGANDVWHITDDGGTEYLIPAIPAVVDRVE